MRKGEAEKLAIQIVTEYENKGGDEFYFVDLYKAVMKVLMEYEQAK